jgi:uncharacterized membrane protein YfcA
MSPLMLLAIALIGAGVGLLSGAFGKGGSAVATPVLHGIGVPAMAAVASPLPAVIPSTLLATRRYAREGHVDRSVLRLGLAIGIPATALGAFASQWTPGASLVLATDVVVLFLGLKVLLGAHDHEDAVPAGAPIHAARAGAVVGVVGLISGLLGNGGGFLLAPLFMRGLRMPVRRALGTSLALSTAFAVPGTIVHAWLGHIDWAVTAAFAFGTMPLATAGAAIALRLKQRTLTLAYGVGLTTLAGGLLLFAH